MSYAKSLLDEGLTGAHLSPSQADCERSAGQLRLVGLGRTCPVVWDGWLCWPPTLGGATIKQPCPYFRHFNTRQFAYRSCLPNGTWYGAGSGRHDSSGWSNYSLCLLSSPTAHPTLPTLPAAHGASAGGYDVALGHEHLVHGQSADTTQTATVTQMVQETLSHVTVPLDDVIGSAVHGVAALCLLLALVIWASLKLTDRLVTKRYLLLIPTVVTSFLFHTIVLTSRLRAVSLSLADPHSPHSALPPPPSPLRAHPPPSHDPLPPSPLRSDHPVPSSPPWRRQFSSPLPKRAPRHVNEIWPAGFQGHLTGTRFVTHGGGGNQDSSFVRHRLADRRSPVASPGGKAEPSLLDAEREDPRLADRRSPVASPEGKTEPSLLDADREDPRAARASSVHSAWSSAVARTGADRDHGGDLVPVDRRRRELNHNDVNEENGDGTTPKATGSKGGDSSTGGPWVTLCQVGRAFYLLADLCVYAFLFSLCVYYTVVVLGKELTFNRLVVMFVLGVSVPVVFVVFTILLYAFLPSHSTFGHSCLVDVLGDEFHWATTAPKLTCLVLSMCLMTVSTYGFWRLHVPALHASSETFYTRQGVLKTLALLLVCSLAELFYLVTEYHKMYDRPTSMHVLHSSTSVLGLKGVVLAVLLCVADSEVLHGTCCAPTLSDSEPWLRTAPARCPRLEEGVEDRLEEVGADNPKTLGGGCPPDAFITRPKHHVVGSRGFGEKV